MFPGPEALVSGCVFRNNTSNPASELVQTTSEIVQSMLFTGRGGGCTFPINPVYSLNATIEDCLFERNFALSFGGGLYVAFNGREHHTVTLHRVKFVQNQAPTAGGLEVGFIRGGIPGADNKLLAYDSEFIENKAKQGGGVFFFTLGIYVFHRDCPFPWLFPLKSDYSIVLWSLLAIPCILQGLQGILMGDWATLRALRTARLSETRPCSLVRPLA